jgi:hypothetical protein
MRITADLSALAIVENVQESYSPQGIAISRVFDYNASYSNRMPKFSNEAIDPSFWNTGSCVILGLIWADCE